MHIKPRDDAMMSNDTKMTLMDNDSSDFEIENSSDNDVENINFKITLSKEEWAEIYDEKKYQANNSSYLNRNYKTLNPGKWTDIVHSHFWEQTKISCTIVYKRAKIYDSGLHFCVFYGKCKLCHSELKGILNVKPPIDNRAIFYCTYKGNYQQCQENQKRRTASEKKTILY